MTLANKTIGNALAGVIGYAWPVALALVTTPYIVSKLGNDAYGILALVTSVLGFFAFLDLGMTNASVKYVSEAYAKNDIEDISKIIGSSLAVFLTIGAFGGALIAIMTSTLVQKILRIPPDYIADSTFAFYVAACGFVLNMVVGVFGAIPKAIQRYDITTKVNIIIGTTLTLSVVLTVYVGYGLKQVVILNFLSSLVSLAVYIFITKKYLQGVSIRIHFDPATFNKLFSFGTYALLVVISSAIVLQLDRLLIGSYLGSSFVAFYVVPASIAAGIYNVVANLTGVIFPLCSHLYAIGEHDKLRELYRKASKYTAMIVISIATPLIVLSNQIMNHWMGLEYGIKSSSVLAILSVSAVFTSLTAIPSFILYGIGMPGVNAKFAMLSAAMNICLCLLLIPWIGLPGAALANLANFVVVILFLITVDRKIMHMGIKGIVKEIWLSPVAIGIIQAAAIIYIFKPFIKSFTSLLFIILVSVGIYYVAAILFKVINSEDKYLLKQYLNFKLTENA
jgi:O-antigen/teichoic acid export membrane protein